MHNHPAYQWIKAYYGEQKAHRSQVPLINHINEGLKILDLLHADEDTCAAFCLHPLFQSDEALAAQQAAPQLSNISPRSLLLCMEYRNIANQYLSQRVIQSLEEIQLSPLHEVQQLLIADKVQNRKDFEIYHKKNHPRSAELDQYFKNWLQRLEINETRYQQLCQHITTK